MFCDGSDDCLFGEDEDQELCYKKTGPAQEQNMNQENRNIKLEDVDISDIADSGSELNDKTSFETTMINVIFTISCISVVGFFLIITIMMFKLVNWNPKPLQIPSKPSFNHQTSNEICNEYVPTQEPPGIKDEPKWTLQTTSIVKELGKGFYSKVYLAQDVKNGYVALKTTDIKKMNNQHQTSFMYIMSFWV